MRKISSRQQRHLVKKAMKGQNRWVTPKATKNFGKSKQTSQPKTETAQEAGAG